MVSLILSEISSSDELLGFEMGFWVFLRTGKVFTADLTALELFFPDDLCGFPFEGIAWALPVTCREPCEEVKLKIPLDNDLYML